MSRAQAGPTAVIVTALPLEANAVKEHLDGIKEQTHEKGTVYFVGQFAGDTTWQVVVVIAGQGNASAAVEVERAISEFHPTITLLVGVAGALKDLDLGDVVAADKVYGYERGKAAKEFLPRPEIGQSTYSLVSRARTEVANDSWQERIKAEQPIKRPKAVVAPIAAGEKVVTSTQGVTYRALRRLFDDAVAVEMEGAGFLAGVYANAEVDALVVCGISDRIDDKGAADAKGSQQRAARHAAAFAFQILAKLGNVRQKEQSRRRILEQRLRESRGRCVERWLGTGIPQEAAEAFADDLTLGDSSEEICPNVDRPLVVLLGDFGAGKSLRCERMYQKALRRSLTDPAAPIPVYLEVFPDNLPTLDDVRASALGVGDVVMVGASVFLERCDEGGQKHALDCLALARQFVNSWPLTTVVLAGRPMSALIETREAVEVPLLTELETCALVSRVSGQPFQRNDLWRWSGALHDALRRPFFAILVGLFLQAEAGHRQSLSTGELIGRVVTEALRRNRTNLATSEGQLARLGAGCVDQGGALVHYSELGGLLTAESLLGSGLVIRRGDRLGFAIPIVGQWFAAQAIVLGKVITGEIISDVQRRQRWLYPLAIATATLSEELVDRLLADLTSNDPALASQVLEVATRGSFRTEQPTLVVDSRCARRAERAWDCWVEGIGDLRPLVGAVGPGGGRLRMEAKLVEEVLSISWLEDEGQAARTQGGTLPRRRFVRQLRTGPVGREPAWVWKLILREFKSRLRTAQRPPAWIDPEDPLSVETVWSFARAVTHQRSVFQPPIPFSQLRTAIGDAPTESQRARSSSLDSRIADLVEHRVKDVEQKGQSELRSPLPTPDITNPADNWVWSIYSEERLIERLRAAYMLAIEGYRYMTDRWFSSFRSQLLHAATLPFKFRGVFSWHDVRITHGDPVPHPGLDYWFEPLPLASESEVEIVPSPASGFLVPFHDQEALRELRRLRPSAASWIWPLRGSTTLDDIFTDQAATRIAQGWLMSDLARINWT